MTRSWRVTLVTCATILAVGGVLAFTVYTLSVRGESVAQIAEERSAANYQAIIAACDLLNRKIVEAQLPPDPASSTALLIDGILRAQPPATRREFLRRLKREMAAPQLTQADCQLEASRAVESVLRDGVDNFPD